jgi:hypothetical protein
MYVPYRIGRFITSSRFVHPLGIAGLKVPEIKKMPGSEAWETQQLASFLSLRGPEDDLIQ